MKTLALTQVVRSSHGLPGADAHCGDCRFSSLPTEETCWQGLNYLSLFFAIPSGLFFGLVISKFA